MFWKAELKPYNKKSVLVCYLMQRHCWSFTLFVHYCSRLLWSGKMLYFDHEFWKMLHMLLLHIVEEMRHSISRVRHVQMCFKWIWFHVCLPLWELKLFKIASIWFCESPNSFYFSPLNVFNFVKLNELFRKVVKINGPKIEK